MTRLIAALGFAAAILIPHATLAQASENGRGRPESPPGQAVSESVRRAAPGRTRGDATSRAAEGETRGGQVRSVELPRCAVEDGFNPRECDCAEDVSARPIMTGFGSLEYFCG
jgi:hypothetical protein